MVTNDLVLIGELLSGSRYSQIPKRLASYLSFSKHLVQSEHFSTSVEVVGEYAKSIFKESIVIDHLKDEYNSKLYPFSESTRFDTVSKFQQLILLTLKKSATPDSKVIWQACPDYQKLEK
ncbi:hypothetical protein HI914_06700 [Erysiphe necator]|nr:hypothetical protein HI914_06700 [Erysiphe necator]